MELKLRLPDYPSDSIEYKSIMNKESPFSFEKFSKVYLRTSKKERKESDFDKSRLIFKLHDYKVYEFENVIVNKYGVLYNDSYEPIQESLNVYGDPDSCLENIGLKEFGNVKEIYLEKEPILFFDYMFSNFGHFVTEAFPRLFLVKELLQLGHKILLPHKSVLTESWQLFDSCGFIKPCLDSLGITEEHIIEIPEEGARFSKLIMPSHVKCRPDVVVPAITHLKNYFYDPDFIWDHRNLYISREDSQIRNITNKEEVELVLCKNFGFKKIVMGNVSFKDKVNIMARTNILVSVDSASPINCIFMPEGSHILVLRSFIFPNYLLILASIFNHKTQYQVCKFSTNDNSWWSGDLLVDPIKLFSKVTNLMKRSTAFIPEDRVRVSLPLLLLLRIYYLKKILRNVKVFCMQLLKNIKISFVETLRKIRILRDIKRLLYAFIKK